MKTKSKYPELAGKTKKLASKFVAEEIETGQYPRKQAIAIGISRARAQTKRATTDSRMLARLKRLVARY